MRNRFEDKLSVLLFLLLQFAVDALIFGVDRSDTYKTERMLQMRGVYLVLF